VAGIGGRGSDILVTTPGVRSSIHYLGILTGFSLHSNFGALPCHQRKAGKEVKINKIPNLLHS